jgi:putative addiction module component (TIGR02574 family)
MTATELLAQALKLPAEEREQMIRALAISLDTDDDDAAAVAEAWDDEIKRRLDDVHNGRVAGIPAATVFEELRARLASRRRR